MPPAKEDPQSCQLSQLPVAKPSCKGTQPAQRFMLRQGACEKKMPLGFLGALLSGKNIWSFDARFKPISQGSEVTLWASGSCIAVETSDYFWNLTFSEVQGCSGSSSTENKHWSLHRGILFDFIVNVLNPMCYPPNALSSTSLAFSSRHSFVVKFWGTKHMWRRCAPCVSPKCSSWLQNLNMLLHSWGNINKDLKIITGTIRRKKKSVSC